VCNSDQNFPVLRVDFGAVNADREGTKTCEDVGRKFDKSARRKIEGAINAFLDGHEGVAKIATVATRLRSWPQR
jgi:hypothetical protein